MLEALRFNNVEEELDYLRSRAESLPHEGDLRREVERVHRWLPESVRNHPVIHETRGDITSLPESAQLNRLIEVTNSKGVFYALSVIEKLKDWKHEDDFHAYLVRLIQEGKPASRGAEKGPIYKATHMTLYEILIPEGVGSEKDLKSVISSMESFYAGMMSVGGEKDKDNYFVIEIANGVGSEEFVFYASVPNGKRDLFEKHVLAVFPKAKLATKVEDYNIFSHGAFTAASYATLSSPSAMPLKTYEDFDHDPLNAVLNSFTKIPKDGAGAAIQLIFKPEGDTYTKRYQNSLKQMEKGVSTKEAIAERTLGGEFVHEIGSLFSKDKKNDKEKPLDSSAIELVRKKLLSPAVSINLRIAACAPSEDEAHKILKDIESSFNQFENPGVNKFKFKETKEAQFFRNFTFRLFSSSQVMPLNLKELTTILHFHTTHVSGASQLKTEKAGNAPAPIELSSLGTLLGVNRFQGKETKIFISPEDRLRHFYTIGQTGTGKSTLLKNMIIQDIQAGEGVCMIDPHGVDIKEVLANVPEERMKDVIYFDPANVENPMGLNMLEYNHDRPEEKTFVVNELFSIFQKLYGGVPESMGPMFEQYFRNATMLVIEDPGSGSTLLDVSRVLSNREYRREKLSKCKNPVVFQFWTEVAEKAGGEAALANIVPYITSKFDVFLANDIMRPIIAQEKSAFNFREIMDERKILLVNLSKGRLGDVNANLLGLIIVGKILMAALSRSGSSGNEYPPFYLHIDEFQNVTTDSIAIILSEARKYKLSLSMAHQFIAQLEENIKNAVFGNVGSICAFRVGADDAEYLEKQFAPVFTAKDLMNVDNFQAYLKMLVNGRPARPFSINTLAPKAGDTSRVASVISQSGAKYGR
ncbi:MAG: DUF87 domain-containing protein, partial [Parcubacteria group bacterium]